MIKRILTEKELRKAIIRQNTKILPELPSANKVPTGNNKRFRRGKSKNNGK